MKPERQAILGAALVCCGLLAAWVNSGVAAPAKVADYQVPTAAQLASGEQLFKLLFAREFASATESIARELGFSWRENETSIVLKDINKRGWGEYRFSKVATGKLVLQIPHRYGDLHTGKIARLVFARRGVISVSLNSVSRRTPVALNPGLMADMAHLPASFHSVYARAFAAQYPDGQLVQLHGFDTNKRRSRAGQQADVIISSGAQWSGAYLMETQRCFGDLGWNALRYPQQVEELGATTNTIGKLLRSQGHGGFIHIELDLETREKLRDDPQPLAAFAACLRGSAP